MSKPLQARVVEEPVYLAEARRVNFGTPAYWNRWRTDDARRSSTAAIHEEIERTLFARDESAARYAWAIPDNDALVAIAHYAPLVEMGAGTGYWASLLRERGVDILAYDIAPPTTDDHENIYHRNEKAVGTTWTEVLCGGPEVAAQHPDRALFLCWPPYDEPMAMQCLRAYAGNTVVYIGEGHGGCTGDDDFHAALDDEWEEVLYLSLPHWHGVRDGLYVYTRTERRNER